MEEPQMELAAGSLGVYHRGPGKRKDKDCFIANGFSYVNNKWKKKYSMSVAQTTG
jgi:hypothetical protein